MKPSSINYQPSSIRDLKVAIVTDWIYGGGGERVVEEIHKMFPDAPIYTSYCSSSWKRRLDGKVVTGYLQHTPFRQLRKFLPLLRQWWFSGLDLSKFDLVISITGNGEAKFVRVPNGTHVSYCHTPVHFYWRKYDEYIKQPGFRPKWLVRLGLRLLLKPLRNRDYKAAQKVDYFIANSRHIQSDIKQFYSKDSVVIHPPIEVIRFSPVKGRPRHGLVIAGRHVPYKHFDIAIEACNKLQLPLTVIGTGPEYAKLKKIGGKTVTFLGRVPDEELEHELASAEAFIFPSFEDFGIAPVEAMASGTPVIAYQAGGALDYVVEGRTGLFFKEQTADSLISALKRFPGHTFRSEVIVKEAHNFDKKHFQKAITDYLNSLQ